MSRVIFVLDLDATITKQEIFPTVAKKIGIYEQMPYFNKIDGGIPFKHEFLKKIELLKNFSISSIKDIIADIELNEKLAGFIRKNKERCYIVTGHLDVWIEGLVERIGIEKNVFSSKALVEGDYIKDIVSVVDKGVVVSQLVLPFAAVGDGNNDASMIDAAEVGIGYGGVRPIAPSILACASHAIYEEEKLVDFLQKLV